jgi:hypothetical protein
MARSLVTRSVLMMIIGYAGFANRVLTIVLYPLIQSYDKNKLFAKQ